MSIFAEKLIQRKFICVLLGILFGFVCAGMGVSCGKLAWNSPLMWAIVWNRMLIGIAIFVAGGLNYNVLFKFRFPAWLRGAALGGIVSAGPSIAALASNPYVPKVFWGFIVAGAVYGLLIDVVATRIAGDGKALLGEWSR